MVMEVMLESKMPLSELVKGIKIYPQLLVNVKVADKDAAMNALLSGYASGVDKYSTYLDEENYASYTSQMDGKYSGIGITVKYFSSTGLLKVVEVNDCYQTKNYYKKYKPNLLIEPELGDMIEYKVERLDFAYEQGYKAGLKYVKKIKKLSTFICVLFNEYFLFFA